MVSWRDVLRRLKEEIDDLSVRCSCVDEADQAVAKLEYADLSSPMELDKCSSCMLMELLNEFSEVIFVPITSSLVSTELYVLDDVVIELGDGVGHVVARSEARRLVERLRELGFEIDDSIIEVIERRPGV